MTPVERWVDRQMQRLALGQFLQLGAEWFAGYLFAFGMLILVVKLLLPQFWPHAAWAAAGLVPVAAVVWRLSRRRRYTRAEAVALLDRRLGMGGLLMTLTEAPDARWSRRLPEADGVWRESLPRVRPVRFVRYLVLPLLFAVGACFVPLRQAETAPRPATVGRQATGELEEMLQAVEEADVVDEEEQRELREEIARLTEETRDTPLTHEKWETVDALRERMLARVETAALSVSKARNAVAALADASEGEGNLLSLEQTEQLEEAVKETLRKLAQNGGLQGASGKAKGELERLLKNGKLKLPEDGEARRKMLDDLQALLDEESEKLGKCRGKCQGKGPGGQDGDEFSDEPGNPGGERPGRGGVSRGRADAELTYGDESYDAASKFKEIVLPPGYADKPRDEVIGQTTAAPEVDAADSAPRAARRERDAASGSETWDRDLRPRHRRVVREYFGEK